MNRIIGRIARFRKLFIVGTHAVAFAAALVVAFLLRFDFRPSVDYWSMAMATLPIFVGLKILIFGALKQYSGWWRFVTLADLLSVTQAATLASLLLGAIVYILGVATFPRGVFVLDWGLTIALLSVIRVAIRVVREKFVGRTTDNVATARRTLVAGTGLTAESLIRETSRSHRLRIRVVGIVTDDVRMVGSRLNGVPILGVVSEIGGLVRELDIEQVVSAFDAGAGDVVRDVVMQCQSADVSHRVLPPADALLDGTVSVSNLREVSLQDLLGRPPVRLESGEIARILNGATVMVTGAGGSIGSEICRQVARFEPGTLVLLEQAENPLFELERELRMNYPNVVLEPLVADVYDAKRLEWAMSHYQPRIVLHAAAHKHVPLMEMNPGEAIKNNVIGTLNVVRAAQEAGVGTFILISTDKAVNPTSVMGATKRFAEMVVQGLAPASETKLAAVRFGNVLGSNGSVIPIFRQQIAAGGPVTVTHPEMQRYFMTIPEATQLVLQAATFANGGEVFVLDMGSPVKIVDLARDMIRLSGLEPERDVRIVFTGMRPGEKLFEELSTDEESTDTTAHSRIFRCRITPPNADNVIWAAGRLKEFARSGLSPAQLRTAIFDVLDVLEKRGSREQIDTAANRVVREPPQQSH